MKLFQKVVRIEGSELQQDKCYLKGIGAYETNHLDWLGRKRKEMYSTLEMAFAWFVIHKYLPWYSPADCYGRNAEKNVKDAYTWLARAYREGEACREGNQIYLFGASGLLLALAGGNDIFAGFSRGAYQVRELASVIHEASTGGPFVTSRMTNGFTFITGWSGEEGGGYGNVSILIILIILLYKSH